MKADLYFRFLLLLDPVRAVAYLRKMRNSRQLYVELEADPTFFSLN
jgi:hypothetical protein